MSKAIDESELNELFISLTYEYVFPYILVDVFYIRVGYNVPGLWLIMELCVIIIILRLLHSSIFLHRNVQHDPVF